MRDVLAESEKPVREKSPLLKGRHALREPVFYHASVMHPDQPLRNWEKLAGTNDDGSIFPCR
ncbi:hypothetical protein ACO03_21100 (plasmid) [Pantoea ananatis]|nr:hypothetical protein ACO03_21100 [Pantoea ananatis]